jgi:hypothetical protein
MTKIGTDAVLDSHSPRGFSPVDNVANYPRNRFNGFALARLSGENR